MKQKRVQKWPSPMEKQWFCCLVLGNRPWRSRVKHTLASKWSMYDRRRWQKINESPSVMSVKRGLSRCSTSVPPCPIALCEAHRGAAVTPSRCTSLRPRCTGGVCWLTAARWPGFKLYWWPCKNGGCFTFLDLWVIFFNFKPHPLHKTNKPKNNIGSLTSNIWK